MRAISTTLLINEIDYDQPSTDTSEFLELKNVGSTPINLDAYSVELVNGTGGGAAVYQTIDLPNLDLAAGAYYVICANAAMTPNCDLDVAPDSNLIQNGDPDAIGLRESGTLIDAISYGGNSGAPYTEGSGVGLDDNPVADMGLSRCPDGTDTDLNNADIVFRGITPGAANACLGDVPPTVASTIPANGAADVATNANISVNFSEPVTVTGSWFSISCSTSGVHAANSSGGTQSFTLDPAADFAFGESCTVTVLATHVTDQDGTPDNMAMNFTFSFTTAAQPFGACGDPATPIHVIQGSGLTSPLNNVTGVIIEGVVVGDYQGSGQFSGFHVQEEDADVDADDATSEGIFVFNTSFPVSAGDMVRARGRVLEFSTSGVFLTELTNVTDLFVCNSGNSVTPASITLPVSNLTDWEVFEGMLVDIPQDMTVTENFTLGRFGEVALSVNGRLQNPTMVTAPGGPAIALQNQNDASSILLDDGNNQQNIDPTLYPAGGLSASNTLRSGDTVNGLTGVLEQRFGVYRVQPVAPISFSAENPRPASPAAVGGRSGSQR